MDFNEVAELDGLDTNVYFQILFIVAYADGEYKDIEKEFISHQAKLMGFDLSTVTEKPVSMDMVDVSEMSSVTKNIILRDCIALAYIDGDYDNVERTKIMDLGRIFNVSEENINEIEQWHKDYLDIIERGYKLMVG